MESQKQVDVVISILKSFKTDPFYEQWERLRAERRGQGSINFFFTFISKTLIDDLRAKYGEKEIETTLAVPHMLTMERLALDYGKTKYDLAFLIPVAMKKDLIIDNKMYIMKDVEILRFFDSHDSIDAESPNRQGKIKEKYPELMEYFDSPDKAWYYFSEVIWAINNGDELEMQRDSKGLSTHVWNLSFLFKNTDGKMYTFEFSSMRMFSRYSTNFMVVKGKLDLW